jgi:hypothetical protein
MAPPLFGCDTAISVALNSKSDINPSTLCEYPNSLLPNSLQLDNSLPDNPIDPSPDHLITLVI